jgi:hypothetical protein
MKISHAAALASIGWYLMVPPLAGRNGPIERGSLLAKWETWFAFDTATECEARVKALEDSAFGRLKAQPVASATKQRISDLQTVSARCVASDDPRLKGN